DSWVLCEGEHYGYVRRAGGCIHNRSVLFSKNDDLWIVVDRVTGTGEHEVRLHWQGGDFPHLADEPAGQLTLYPPSGPFSITVMDDNGRPLPCSVVSGGEALPRGWISRYYGEKTAAPSLAASAKGSLPLTMLTVLCGGGRSEIQTDGCQWRVRFGKRELAFSLTDGSLTAEIPAMAKA